MFDDDNLHVVVESAIENGVGKALQIDTPVGHRLEVGGLGIFTNRLKMLLQLIPKRIGKLW